MQNSPSRETISKRLIKKMIENTHDEERYIEYFKQWVANISDRKSENTSPELQLKFGVLPNYIPEPIMQNKQNQGMGIASKRGCKTVEISTKRQITNDGQDDEYINKPDNKCIFNGQKKDRVTVRYKIFTQLSA